MGKVGKCPNPQHPSGHSSWSEADLPFFSAIWAEAKLSFDRVDSETTGKSRVQEARVLGYVLPKGYLQSGGVPAAQRYSFSDHFGSPHPNPQPSFSLRPATLSLEGNPSPPVLRSILKIVFSTPVIFALAV